MRDELGIMWTEVVVAYLKVIYRHLCGVTEENYKYFHSE
jgi:hypothetical protein